MKRPSPMLLVSMLLALVFHAYTGVSYIVVSQPWEDFNPHEYSELPSGFIRDGTRWLHKPLVSLDPRPEQFQIIIKGPCIVDCGTEFFIERTDVVGGAIRLPEEP